MSALAAAAICVLTGYFFGSVNLSYLLGKLRGYDIRTVGSGNAGASNALIMMGPKTGVLIALCDIGKAFGVTVLMRVWLSGVFAYSAHVTAAACILGHMFPFYMRFRGGKGLACLGGVILAFDWRMFLLLLAAEFLVVLVSDYLCFVPLTASLLFPLLVFWGDRDPVGALLLLLPAAAIWLRHIPNLRRIAEGKELHFSYLWKKKKEIERITDKKENET